MYLLTEIQKVYRAQGQNINDKHFEVVVRKMVGKVQITRPGDSPYLPLELIDRLEVKEVNERLVAEGKQVAKYTEILLGVTKASLSTESFLSAASFQHTIKVLAGAAIASTEDPLFGLKENVIIGKLIPAGTGFTQDRFDPTTARRFQNEKSSEAEEEASEEVTEAPEVSTEGFELPELKTKELDIDALTKLTLKNITGED
jgi:DNA-directed RNA polymerase subunit beta'